MSYKIIDDEIMWDMSFVITWSMSVAKLAVTLVSFVIIEYVLLKV